MLLKSSFDPTLVRELYGDKMGNPKCFLAYVDILFLFLKIIFI